MFHIGCSGWQYKDWKGRFYPADITQKEWLEFYAQHFSTVEVNSTFYRTQTNKTVQAWSDRTPDDFVFTIKGSRYVTHIKRLIQPKEGVTIVDDEVKPVEHKLGCVLWQMPPTFKNTEENFYRVDQFCNVLDKKKRHVLEFRHDSWYQDDVYDLLKKHKVTFCVVSAPDFRDDIILTTNTLYVRFHGMKGWYAGLYPKEELEKWAKRIKQAGAKDVFIYFNNDMAASAVQNAKEMKEIFGV